MSVDVTTAVRVPGEVRQWYRDPISCLQATLASVLCHAGVEPLPVLGLAWEFRYRPGDVRREEFYYPCRFDGDPARSLAPYHPVRSTWWRPAGADPLADVRDRLAAGELVIAAVDNYHLPFRPAYHDVHAAHLLVVYGMSDDEVLVSDTMPPAFQGAIRVGDFLRGWSSGNPRDVQDAFFSDARIDRRCLSVRLDGPVPPVDADLVGRALRANLALFAAPGGVDPDGPGPVGLAGLRHWLDRLAARAVDGDQAAVEEVYPLGWGMQAQAYLHGELLRTLGAAWDLPALREAGRAVESVAYTWTGLRMAAAHGRGAPRQAAAALTRHGTRLHRRYEEAVEAVQRALDAL